MTVWVVGSINQDFQLEVEHHPTSGETVRAGDPIRRCGGKGANQAVAAAGAGARTVMIGAVGSDQAGADCLAQLVAHGVETDHVEVVDRDTGTAVVATDAAGDNVIIVASGANLSLSVTDVARSLASVAASDVVLLQLEIDLAVAAETIRQATARGARVVANLAPWAALPADLLGRCDPVVVNSSEAAELRASGIEVASLLVTEGAGGSRWGEVVVPADPVTVVDTTGAGDAYCGALAAALAGGVDRQEAMVAATRAAGICVGHHGAQPRPDGTG